MSAEVANIAGAKRKQEPVASAPVAWGAGRITPPSLTAVAPHARLFSLLDAALARPIVWLQGPPGAGKTTLVASWLAARRLEPVWQRLDAEESDPSTFFFYLGMAEARARGADAAPRLPPLTPEYQFGAGAFSRNFFQKLFEGANPPIVVFDDYQEVGPASAVHDLLAKGLKEIPHCGHVIVLSRAPPPKEFARLRVNGQVEVLAPENLLLQAEEAAAIAEMRGVSLDAERLEQALDLSRGWTAGLILVLEAARSGVAIQAGGAGTAPELLFDYFAGEVLNVLGEKEQRTLLCLAAMPGMTAEAAAKLADDPSAGELLERLARRGYFTTSDAEDPPNYHFHPLFQQFLWAEARRKFGEAEWGRLRLDAARSLAESGQPEAAAAMLCEAGAWDELARLICAAGPRLIESGRHKTLSSWCDMLPPSWIEASGWLSYWAGISRLPFAAAASRPVLRRALTMFAQTDDATGAFLAWSQVVLSILTDDFADNALLDELVVQLRDLVGRFPSFPSAEIEGWVAVGMYAALSRRSIDRAEIASWKQRAITASQKTGNRALLALVRLCAVVYDLIDANYASAQEQLAVMPRPESLADAPLERSMVYLALVAMQHYRQAPGSCVETAELAHRNDSAAGIYPYSHWNAGFAAQDCLRDGALDSARFWLDRCAAYTDRVSGERSGFYYGVNAIAEFYGGNIDRAMKSARNGIEVGAAAHYPNVEGHLRSIYAELLIVSGDLVGAAEQIAMTERVLSQGAVEIIRLRLEFERAEFLHQNGREEEGLAALRKALELGKSSGARRLLLIHPLDASLCARALAHDIEPEYTRQLIQLSPVQPPEDLIPEWPRPLKVVTLGSFQLLKDGEPLALSRKTPRRLFNVLKAIAAFGGCDVPQEKIIDAVWTDEDGDSARQSFDVAVHRLRKLLGDAQAIVVRNGKIGFDPTRCFFDVWGFEKACACKGPPSEAAERGLRLYHGDFLSEDENLPWAVPLREKLRAQYVKAIETHASAWQSAGDFSHAEELYGAGFAACPDAEPLYQGFFRCCGTTGHKSEAIEAYRRLHVALAEAGRAPSPTTEAHFHALDA